MNVPYRRARRRGSVRTAGLILSSNRRRCRLQCLSPGDERPRRLPGACCAHLDGIAPIGVPLLTSISRWMFIPICRPTCNRRRICRLRLPTPGSFATTRASLQAMTAMPTSCVSATRERMPFMPLPSTAVSGRYKKEKRHRAFVHSMAFCRVYIYFWIVGSFVRPRI